MKPLQVSHVNRRRRVFTAKKTGRRINSNLMLNVLTYVILRSCLFASEFSINLKQTPDVMDVPPPSGRCYTFYMLLYV